MKIKKLLVILLTIMYCGLTMFLYGCNKFKAEIATGQEAKIDHVHNDLKVYSDRPYVFEKLPEIFNDCDYLRMANEDKENSFPNYLRINSSSPLDIYLLFDKRIAGYDSLKPIWLNKNWVKNEKLNVTTDAILNTNFIVYEYANVNDFPLFLGGNKKQDMHTKSSMYEIFVRTKNNSVAIKNSYKAPYFRTVNKKDSILMVEGLKKHNNWVVDVSNGRRLESDENDFGAHFDSTIFFISGADLSNADMAHKKFKADTLAFCTFNQTLLSRSTFKFSYITNCDFKGSTMIGTFFDSANLINCNFTDCDFTGASLFNSNMVACDLSGSIFEPINLPNIESMIGCKGFNKLAFRNNAARGYALARQFKESGFKTQYMDIIYSLNKYKTSKYNWLVQVLRDICFDFTCAYGTSSFRLVLVFIGFTFAFSLVYSYIVYKQLCAINNREIKKVGKVVFFISDWECLKIGLFYSIKFSFRLKWFENLPLESFFAENIKSTSQLETPTVITYLSYLQTLTSSYLIGLFLFILLDNPFESFLI